MADPSSTISGKLVFPVVRERRPAPKPSIAPVPGQLVGERYRVGPVLGRGGMGVVVRAFDVELEREVAIKLVRPERAAKMRSIARFQQEARAMASVRHDNIANVFALGEHEGQPYIVMELVPGASLAQFIKQHRAVGPGTDIEETVSILEQICRGLDAIHDAGIIHGDIKPGNVLVGPELRSVVTDFGLMRWLGEAEDLSSVAGTPAYMAPEFVTSGGRGLALSPAADVYAVGVTAFEMLTGRLPYEIHDVDGLFDVHGRRVPRKRLVDLRPDCPLAFEEVMERVLSRDLTVRYRNAGEFARDMLAALRATPAPASCVRIVIADHDEAFRDLAVAALGVAFPGAEIETTRDGAAALAAVEARRADLVLADLRLPLLDGIELTAVLRGPEYGQTMPIIVVTDDGDANDWRLLQSLGASGFLVKPFDPHQLAVLARRLVR